MALLTEEGRPVRCRREDDDLEALIREARRLRRRRWLASAGVAVCVVGLVGAALALTNSSPTAKRPPVQRHVTAPRLSPSPAEVAFLHLAARGSSGTFQATFDVRGDLVPYGGPHWIVTVTHQGRGPGGGSVGRWSYLLSSSIAGTVQWVEKGSRYVDCYRHNRSAVGQLRITDTWRCGTGTNWGSIGFSYLGLPFIPEQVARDIQAAIDNRGWDPSGRQYDSVALFSRTSQAFGREACLRSTVRLGRIGVGFDGIGSISTWCLNARGLPVSFHSSGRYGGTLWDDVRLLQYQAVPSAYLLAPLGVPMHSVPLPAM